MNINHKQQKKLYRRRNKTINSDHLSLASSGIFHLLNLFHCIIQLLLQQCNPAMQSNRFYCHKLLGIYSEHNLLTRLLSSSIP